MAALSSLNNLLDAKLDDIAARFPNAEEIIATRLGENEKHFRSKTRGTETEEAINRMMQEKILAIEAALAKLPIWKPLHEKDGLKNTVRYIYSLCPKEKKQGLFLKENVASDILRKMPPVDLLKNVPEKEVRALSPLSVLAVTRFTESKEWQDAYLERLAQLSKKHFEKRDIRCLVIDSAAFEGALRLAGKRQKPWRISHNKETGIITCFSLDVAHALPAPLTQYISVFMHYFFEIAVCSESAETLAQRNPEKVGEHYRQIIRSHQNKFEFFHPNAYAEHLFWERALILFVASFPEIEELQYFGDTIDCGGYLGDTVVSLNLVDHIWNVNLRGQAATAAYFGDACEYFLYHFREALWYDLFRQLLDLSKEEKERMVIEHLGLGDVPYTERMMERTGT